MRILAIDPGLRCCGWAVHEDRLQACGLLRADTKQRGAVQWAAMVDKAQDLWVRLNDDKTMPDFLYVEYPQIYGPCNYDDLLELTAVAGSMFGVFTTSDPVSVRPREWKGQVPKKIHNERILDTLDPFEQAIVEDVKPKSLRHNAIDAVGIALWAAGRMRPKRKKTRYRR